VFDQARVHRKRGYVPPTWRTRSSQNVEGTTRTVGSTGQDSNPLWYCRAHPCSYAYLCAGARNCSEDFPNFRRIGS
jgi:hypothetical protein